MQNLKKTPFKMIMMKCPSTGRVVSTGTRSSYFEMWHNHPPKDGGQFLCPECGKTHTFDDTNTWLEGDKPK